MPKRPELDHLEMLLQRTDNVYHLLAAVIQSAMVEKDDEFMLSPRLKNFLQYWHMPISADYLRKQYNRYKSGEVSVRELLANRRRML